jgi:uncharacterized protein YcnI
MAALFGFFVLSLALLSAGAAEAHVDVVPNSASTGDFAKLFFRVYHGCDNAPTVRVTVHIPDGITVPRPQVKAGWEISTKSTQYAKPVQMGGKPFSQGFNEITWTGGSVGADYMDDFPIGALMPQTPGKYRFLVTQQCAGVAEPAQFSPELSVEGGGGGSILQYIPLILAALGLIVGVAALVIAVNRNG